MGVINITPNSFSDPNKFNDSIALKSTIDDFKSITNNALDFGFESSAPMNKAISKEDERSRFDLFFEQIKDLDLHGHWISFDTYRPSNYQHFEKKWNERFKNCGFIFNDVSGLLDEEILEFLKLNIHRDNFHYLLSNTHIPSRDQVLSHMNFQNNEDIIKQTYEHFFTSCELLNKFGIDTKAIKNKIIFDPGFGFSKSYDQNWDLLNRFDELVLLLKEKKIEASWLIGISKKSFLRKAFLDKTDPFAESELLHAKILNSLLSKNCGHLIFRVHNPRILMPD